ncbi:hypothetical protein C8R46DRAFT_1030541 [Mycena filopes]|nr:hypothetical protein C8R46DRAFT_1030541 [Mycena filopes]
MVYRNTRKMGTVLLAAGTKHLWQWKKVQDPPRNLGDGFIVCTFKFCFEVLQFQDFYLSPKSRQGLPLFIAMQMAGFLHYDVLKVGCTDTVCVFVRDNWLELCPSAWTAQVNGLGWIKERDILSYLDLPEDIARVQVSNEKLNVSLSVRILQHEPESYADLITLFPDNFDTAEDFFTDLDEAEKMQDFLRDNAEIFEFYHKEIAEERKGYSGRAEQRYEARGADYGCPGAWCYEAVLSQQEPPPPSRSQKTLKPRQICQIFLQLLKSNHYPDYYQIIPNPISMSRIRVWVQKPLTLAQYRDDWHLLFQNARDYNVPGSRVYEDANFLQKVFDRKFLANFTC